MLTRDDLELIQKEALRQQDVTTRKLKRAESTMENAERRSRQANERLLEVDERLTAIAPLLDQWGRDDAGELDPDRPMLKKDIDAHVAELRAERETARAEAKTRTAALLQAEQAQKNAKAALDKANQTLRKIDIQLRRA